jgi:hypothetical protein
MAPDNRGDSGSSVPLGDNSASSDIVEQARGRSDGFDIGGDRAIVSTPNWNNQASNQLYLGATQNNEPGTAEATGQAWTAHAYELSHASNDLYTAISELGAAWIGQGAAAAQGALVGIANSGSQASEAAHTMASRLAQQAAAAAEVKKMPAPRNYDPASAMTAALAGGPAALVADQKVQADAAADVKAQQVAFFTAYTKAMSDVDRSTPSFGPESLGMKPMTGSSSVAYNQVSGTVHQGDLAGVGQGGAASVFSHTSPAFDGHDFGQGSQGGQAGFTPVAGQAGPGVSPGAGSAAAAVVPPAVTGGGHTSLAVGAGIGALGGALGVAGGRKLFQGNRSGGKKADADATEVAANDGSGQGAASAGVPQQGVVSPGGTIGGSPAQPPMGPVGGMGGAGGAHQQEDEQHTHASFLIDPDPDETFGANQATPPPVIGAWSDDEER